MNRYETTVELHDHVSICELRQFMETALGQAEAKLVLDDIGAPKAVHIIWTTQQGPDEYSTFDVADHVQELKTCGLYFNVERPTLVGVGLPIAAVETVDRFDEVTP